VSVLEAFASGLPVVSTGTGDIAAMVRHGETGLIVPQDDPAAMAEALSALLGDPDRALHMTQRARATVARHAWPEVRASWAEAYGRWPIPARTAAAQ
jgi:phenylacetate-CoA ligase